MDIYLKTPGANLIGIDRITFDNVRAAAEKSTSDYLLRPDWDANLRCVELIQAINNLDLLGEIMLLLRKKLRSAQPKVVVLTLRLMETLTTNCESNWFYALNDEKCTKDLASTARKYVSKPGVENKEVTDTILDIIQGWGEAFLPKKKQFPNIVELYFTLRKEGLPFKVNAQFDPNRVPLFAKPSSSGSGGDAFLDAHTDGILAATVQASMDLNRPKPYSANAGSNISNNTPNRPAQPPPPPAPAVPRSNSISGPSFTAPKVTRRSSQVDGILDAIVTSMTILKDLITASTSIWDLKSNEVIEEIVEQVKHHQSEIHSSIESSMNNPDLLANLFKYNDLSQTLLSVYNDIKDGTLTLAEGQKVISTTMNFDNSGDNNNSATDTNPPSTSKDNKSSGGDLLLDYSPTPTPPSSAAKKPAISPNNDLDFFVTPAASSASTAPAVTLPVASAVASNSDPFDPFGITPSTATSAAAAVNSPPTATSPAVVMPIASTNSNSSSVRTAARKSVTGGLIPKLAPPPSSSSSASLKPIPALAPPPKAGSTIRANSINESSRRNLSGENLPPANLLDDGKSNPSNPPSAAVAPVHDPFGLDNLIFPPSSSTTQPTVNNKATPVTTNPVPPFGFGPPLPHAMGSVGGHPPMLPPHLSAGPMPPHAYPYLGGPAGPPPPYGHPFPPAGPPGGYGVPFPPPPPGTYPPAPNHGTLPPPAHYAVPGHPPFFPPAVDAGYAVPPVESVAPAHLRPASSQSNNQSNNADNPFDLFG